MNFFIPSTYKFKSINFLAIAMFFMSQIAIAQNPTSGGTISTNQTVCQGQAPATLTSNAPATGGNPNQDIEYLWMSSTTINGIPGGNTYTAIPGTNSLTYTPGPLNSTTNFIRCARRINSGVPEFTAESNVITVNVLSLPTANINGNPVSGFAGLCANYSAPYGGPGSTYSWNFGNGTTGSGQTPSKATYNVPGTYTVSLTVTGGNGCSITTTTEIIINPPSESNTADPCNCNDPLNISDLTTLEYYNHDYIFINSNPGETWTIVNIAGFGGGIVNQNLAPIGVGTVIPESSPGVYYSNVWFNGALGGWQVTLMNSNGVTLTTGPGNISSCPICPNAPLPVELVNFDANVVNSTVVLKWATASESNNSHFELERSTDGGDRFEVIAEVVANLGNSSSLQSYDFTDDNPVIGDNYYRLKQVDFDGEFEYFNTTIARIESDNIGLQVVPNPVKDIATIQIGNDIPLNTELQLLTSFGELVKTISVTNVGGNEYINLEELPSGIYFITLKNRSNIFQKIIKL